MGATETIWNAANALTVARLVMCVVFVALLSVPYGSTPWQPRIWEVGYVLAVAAGFTDFLDGYVARKYNLVTEFGAFLDPLSDKIFAVAGFVMLTEKQIFPGWVTVLILSREFAVQGLRQFAQKKGRPVAVSYLGKVKTTIQMIALAVGGAVMVQWIPEGLWGAAWLWSLLVGMTALITLYTGCEYFYAASYVFKEL